MLWQFEFAVPGAEIATRMREALDLVARHADKCDCLIWDRQTRETFSVAAWKGRRLGGWQGNLPNIRRHIVLHFYRDGNDGLARVISLGMEKFGLPDIVTNKIAVSNGRAMGNLVNVIAQHKAEGVRPAPDGRFRLNIKALRHKAERQSIIDSQHEGAEDIVDIRLATTPRQKGDPANRLVEVVFSDAGETDPQARQHELVSRVFGSKDDVSQVKQQRGDPGGKASGRGRNCRCCAENSWRKTSNRARSTAR